MLSSWLPNSVIINSCILQTDSDIAYIQNESWPVAVFRRGGGVVRTRLGYTDS